MKSVGRPLLRLRTEFQTASKETRFCWTDSGFLQLKVHVCVGQKNRTDPPPPVWKNQNFTSVSLMLGGAWEELHSWSLGSAVGSVSAAGSVLHLQEGELNHQSSHSMFRSGVDQRGHQIKTWTLSWMMHHEPVWVCSGSLRGTTAYF